MKLMKLKSAVARVRKLKESGGSKYGPAVPDDLNAALRTDKHAEAAFAALAPSHQREYVKWVSEAKRLATRKKRIAATLKHLNGQTRRR